MADNADKIALTCLITLTKIRDLFTWLILEQQIDVPVFQDCAAASLDHVGVGCLLHLLFQEKEHLHVFEAAALAQPIAPKSKQRRF